MPLNGGGRDEERALVVPLLCLVPLAACDFTPRQHSTTAATTTTAPPRFFDEKVRCATVGERWEKRMCEVDGKMTPPCQGWWAYHPQRDTCVGVFHQVTLTRSSRPNERPSRFETLFVFDMLSRIDLEDGCIGDESIRCDPEGAKKRWITPEGKP